MDFTQITQAVANIGVPAVMCFILLYMMQKNNEMHKAEVDSLKDVISDVKVAITELKDAINGMKGE